MPSDTRWMFAAVTRSDARSALAQPRRPHAESSNGNLTIARVATLAFSMFGLKRSPPCCPRSPRHCRPNTADQLRSGAPVRLAGGGTGRHLSLQYGCRPELRQLHPLVRWRRGPPPEPEEAGQGRRSSCRAPDGLYGTADTSHEARRSSRTGRAVQAVSRETPLLLAGGRVSGGDDTRENRGPCRTPWAMKAGREQQGSPRKSTQRPHASPRWAYEAVNP